MAKTKKTIWTVLLLWLIIVATTAYSDEGPITKLYFKNGSVIECDMVWEGAEHAILSMKSGKITGYSIDEVDLEKTFGKIGGKDIAERYEAERKKRELMSTLFKPKQHRAEGEQLERVNEHKKSIELEKRLLKNKLKNYKEKYRKASEPPPKGRMGFNNKEFYRRKIESIEKKIEELERDPKFYFYGKSQQRDVRGNAEVKSGDKVTLIRAMDDGITYYVRTSTGIEIWKDRDLYCFAGIEERCTVIKSFGSEVLLYVPIMNAKYWFTVEKVGAKAPN